MLRTALPCHGVRPSRRGLFVALAPAYDDRLVGGRDGGPDRGSRSCARRRARLGARWEVALALAERHPASEASLVLVDSSIGDRARCSRRRTYESALDDPAATPTSVAPTLFANDLLSGAGGSVSAESAVADALATTVPDDLTRGALAEERAVQSARRVVQHVPRLERRVGSSSRRSFRCTARMMPCSRRRRLAAPQGNRRFGAGRPSWNRLRSDVRGLDPVRGRARAIRPARQTRSADAATGSTCPPARPRPRR